MKILIIGGYGSFGRRLTENLLQNYGHNIVVSGRSLKAALAFQAEIKQKYGKQIEICTIDVMSPSLNEDIHAVKPDIVVNASGPFQYQSASVTNYLVARACIENHCHYIDLADDRDFVNQFEKNLSQNAKKARCMLVSGASTVPGLTCAVIDQFQNRFSELNEVYFGISPGNQFNKGKATIGSILTYTGKPFRILQDSQWREVFGWQGLQQYEFETPIGIRWMADCQIPDLDLLPLRYPQLKTVRFQAGLELRFMHFAMWMLGYLVRLGVIRNLYTWAGSLAWAAKWFIGWGTDVGGMFVQMRGLDHAGAFKTIDWQLIAEKGTGPNVPVISAEVVIQQIANGTIVYGAMPCIGLFSLEDFFKVADRWGIYQRTF